MCVCVCVSLSVCVRWRCLCPPAAMLGTTASSATEPFAACKTAFVARRHLFGAHGQRSYCQLPPAPRIIAVKLNASIDGLLFTPLAPPPPPPFLRRRTQHIAQQSVPLSLRNAFPGVPRSASSWCAITGTHPALCALVSPPAAAQLICLGSPSTSCNASLPFRAWPRTSVLRTPVGAQSQPQAAGGHRLVHERFERGLACATEPEPQSVSTVESHCTHTQHCAS